LNHFSLELQNEINEPYAELKIGSICYFNVKQLKEIGFGQ